MDGGYDGGYRSCACFWGAEPGRFVKRLIKYVQDFRGRFILDAGCGEGKNAVFLSKYGAIVRALDISEFALANAQKAWERDYGISWEIADVRRATFSNETFDIVIAYGLLHCLASIDEVRSTVIKFQNATKEGGYHVICSFNDRHQDLSGHPEFYPCLASHEMYLDLYSGWSVLEATDSDHTETHPHNNIKHTHSLTRILARKD